MRLTRQGIYREVVDGRGIEPLAVRFPRPSAGTIPPPNREGGRQCLPPAPVSYLFLDNLDIGQLGEVTHRFDGFPEALLLHVVFPQAGNLAD